MIVNETTNFIKTIVLKNENINIPTCICIYMCLINYFFVYLFKFKQGHFSSYIHAYLKSLKEQKIYSR